MQGPYVLIMVNTGKGAAARRLPAGWIVSAHRYWQACGIKVSLDAHPWCSSHASLGCLSAGIATGNRLRWPCAWQSNGLYLCSGSHGGEPFTSYKLGSDPSMSHLMQAIVKAFQEECALHHPGPAVQHDEDAAGHDPTVHVRQGPSEDQVGACTQVKESCCCHAHPQSKFMLHVAWPHMLGFGC